MTNDKRTWGELLESDPGAVLDLLLYVVNGATPDGLQVLLRLQREGQPSLLLGVEDENYDPEDFEAMGRGGVALIAAEHARMVRAGDAAVEPLPSDTQDLDERLERLARTGAYIAAQIDQLLAQKAGIASAAGT